MDAVVPLIFTLLWWQAPRPCQGGHCWNAYKNGRCTGQLTAQVSKEHCCSTGSANTAWTEEDLDSGRIFFWGALGGGVPNCIPCKKSCSGVECPVGKKCLIRKNQPRCVCAPDCSKAKRKGPVCATDGHTYRNYCTLLKKSCRKRKQLQVAYYGPCQKSCDALKCPGKKQCLLDQNLTPHCVRCSRTCPDVKTKSFVCGVDGLTYNSFCHLRQAACQKGRAIPVAYQGRCKASATCDKVRCTKGKTCLSEPGTGRPRCTTCHYNCRAVKLQLEGPVCATNNVTYPSWCHMMQAACNLSTVLEVRSNTMCEDDNSTQEPNSIPLFDGGTSSTRT